MVLEKEILPLYDWLFLTLRGPGALILFLAVVAGLTVASLIMAYLRCVILYGPGEGFYAVAKAMSVGLSQDLPKLSFRRTWAVGRLTIQESIRRWVLAAFVVFAVILLFAGWFLDVKSDHPVRIYLNFVLTATELMILILAGVLCTFSIPNDIKTKTIYTIVTKPVRASEIVLGRILGFCAVNTAILVMMGVVSYGFVTRGLDHKHTISPEAMEQVTAKGPNAGGWKGRTSSDSFHFHEVTLDAKGEGQTDTRLDHQHAVTMTGEGDQRKFVLGPPDGELRARVPIYGKLEFVDRAGNPREGISVGKEWTYRQYIEGGSLSAGAWTFSDVTPERFPDGLPIEMNISIFRTYKGDIVSGVSGTLTLRNPDSKMRSEELTITPSEFTAFSYHVPRKLRAQTKEGTLEDVDIFDKLVSQDGKVEIWLQCSEHSQYYGMAQPDLYLRGKDGSFILNFAKSYVGIWLQMIIITCFGVMFSTFLSGPVAMFATLIVYLIGMFKTFIIGVASGTLPGGGPLESLIRLLTQKNIVIGLDMGPVVDRAVPIIDKVLMFFVWVAAEIFPDYRSFNTSRFVAYGYNIDGNLLSQHCLITVAFVLVLSVYGYFFLKSREIAG